MDKRMWWRIDRCNQVPLGPCFSPTKGRNWTQCFTDVSVTTEPQTYALINWRGPLTRGSLFKKKKKKKSVFCFLLLKFGVPPMKLAEVYLPGWDICSMLVYLGIVCNPTTSSFPATFAHFV